MVVVVLSMAEEDNTAEADTAVAAETPSHDRVATLGLTTASDCSFSLTRTVSAAFWTASSF